MKNKKDILHLMCACYSHELHIQKDHELNMWYISFWQQGYVSKTPWKYRLKSIWHIIKHGTPYGDEVILNKEDMKQLRSYIEKQIGKR